MARPPITTAELARRLAAADPVAVLARREVVRRVIRHDRDLLGFARHIPHDDVYPLAAARLLELVDRSELEVTEGRELPAEVVLISAPDDGDVPAAEALLLGWRRLFHGRVHLALEARRRAGALDQAALQERLRRLGPHEWEEAVTVLGDEGRLLPPDDAASRYAELAALYLELEAFGGTLLPAYFPSLTRDPEVGRLLAEDVDAPALLAATRPEGAPDPEPPAETTSEEPQAFYRRLRREATELAESGNRARAAIVLTRAARVAPAEHDQPTRAEARRELRTLVAELQALLRFDADRAAEWGESLDALVDKADQGVWPQEARLLYDLQAAADDGGRRVFRLNELRRLVRGARLREELPYEPEIRLARHLTRARRRLPAARLQVAERERLGRLLRAGLDHIEESLRARLRPTLVGALRESGVAPASVPERVVFDKIIEELLDRLTARRFFTFGDLRDALSTNQLKLGDLGGLGELARGDALLQVDRRLSRALPGLYRPGEVYRRGLQRLSALLGATRAGRFLVWVGLLPIGAAFVLLAATGHLAHAVREWSAPAAEGAAEGAAPAPAEGAARAAADAASGASPVVLPEDHLTDPASIAAVAVVLALVINVAAVRAAAARAARAAGRALKAVALDLPAALLRLGWLRRLLGAELLHRVGRYALLPGVPTSLTSLAWWWTGSPLRRSPLAHVALFAGLLVLLNNRWWLVLEERIGDQLVLAWRYLRIDFLPRLFQTVMRAFRRLGEALETVVYSVDERLRFRSDDGRLLTALKALLTPLWRPVAYLLRLSFDVCVEPRINPIKYVSVVMVVDKLFIPLTPELVAAFRDAAAGLGQGPVLANTFAWVAVYALPAAVGFLVWELKENWRLYRANRGRSIEAQPLTLHGQTLPRLMRAGGTGGLPGIYARLRRAEREAHRTGDWTASRRQRAALEEAEAKVRRFVERELLRLLAAGEAWDEPPRVGAVQLGLTRVRIELEPPAGWSGPPARLAFEDDAGWLVAALEEPGWTADLDPERRRTLEVGLFGLYKAAGVELVQEQVRATLDRVRPDLEFQVEERGLEVWPAGRRVAAVRYDLEASAALVEPEPIAPDGAPPSDAPLPALPADAIAFARVEVGWERWVEALEREAPVPWDPGRTSLLPDPAPDPPEPARAGEPEASG